MSNLFLLSDKQWDCIQMLLLVCKRGFRRWAEKGIWEEVFTALAAADLPERVIIDSTIVRAHRCASGGTGCRVSCTGQGRRRIIPAQIRSKRHG